MSRSLSDIEWDRLKNQFPDLCRCHVKVINENVDGKHYNCFAWSLGFTHGWYTPPSGLVKTEDAYEDVGSEKLDKLSNDANIDIWGPFKATMVHASRRLKYSWTSKIANDLCITHKREELGGNYPPAYGKIYASFRLRLPPSKVALPGDFLYFDEAKASVSATVKFQKVPQSVCVAFDDAFKAWKSTWFQGNRAFDSDARSRAQGDAFDNLVEMNRQVDILPLLISKLAEPDNFIALVLHEKIENDPHLLVPVDWNNLMSDQQRSLNVVKLWLEHQ